MKLLITGALGHIGSRLIHSLRPGDFTEVVLLDDLSTQRYVSLFNLPADVPFRFIETDVCAADLHALFSGIDVVIHLAAITDAAASFEVRDQVEKVNFEGSRRVAQACVVRGCRLISLSTTSVYGTQQSVVDEDCSREELKPQSPYADSKLRTEELLQELGGSVGLKFISCRFGTIYGASPGMRFHTAINKFCWQACLGQPLTVWRTAMDQKRPYLELGDAVRAMQFILERDLFDNRTYNVLTSNSTVGEALDVIRHHVPDLTVNLVDAAVMNQLSYTVSNQRFRSLGFEFVGSLHEGIRETIELLRNAHCRP